MPYWVHGTNEGGLPLTPYYSSAHAESEARAEAAARGMVVEKVEQVSEQPPPKYTPSTWNNPSRWSLEAQSRLHGVIECFKGVGLILLCPTLFIGWLIICDRNNAHPSSQGVGAALIGTLAACWWGIKAFYRGLTEIVSGKSYD